MTYSLRVLRALQALMALNSMTRLQLAGDEQHG